MKILPLLLVMLFMACPGDNMSDSYSLPEPLKTDRPIEECLSKRRSVRFFSEDTLTPEQVSTLLWAAQGITDEKRGFRTAPSAGATYPLEVYLVAPHGIFQYNPQEHSLSLKKAGDYRPELEKACLGQPSVGKAYISIILTAVTDRTSSKYGERAMRYIWLEAGHSAQNVLLEATALGLGAVPVGAFNDDAVSKLLELDSFTSNSIPLYVIPVGVPLKK